MLPHTTLRKGLLATALLAATAGSALATPQYALLTTIPIPPDAANVQPGGAFSSFDISTFDPTTGYLYLADRSNASIDVFNGNTNTFVGQIGGFVGQASTTATSGADGTVVAITPTGQHLVLGGDGNSTVKSFNIPADPSNLAGYTPAVTASTVLPGSTARQAARADEMTYDPKDNLVLVANNAATPTPYTTIFNATTGAVVAQTLFDGIHAPLAGSGVEASAYDPKSGNFYIAMPQFGSSATDPGGIVVIDPTGNVVQSYKFSDQGIGVCSPTGLDISAGGKIAVGCGAAGSQTVIFDPATGKIIATPKISGTDELYYDASIDAFLVTGANDTLNGGKPDFGIVDAVSGSLVQTLLTSPGNDHSIAGGMEIFVPFTANPGNTACPSGCLAVYAQVEVPEPGTLPVLATALVAFLGLAVRRRYS